MPLRPSSKPKIPERNPPPAPPAEAAAANPDLDVHLQSFWEKYNRPILALCAVILLGLVGKDLWEYLAIRKEAGVQREFAAATSPAMQKSFIAEHPDNPLSGVADLQIADAAYAANQMPAAIDGYSQAADLLKTGPFAARARLGLAMSRIQSGQEAEGEEGLHALMDDAQGYKAIRAEAAYHLASLAALSGRSADLQKLASQMLQIDPNSPWTEKVLTLQVRQSAAGPAPAAPGGVTFKP